MAEATPNLPSAGQGGVKRLRKQDSLRKKPCSLIPVRVRRPLAALQPSAGKPKHSAKTGKPLVCTPSNPAPHPRSAAHTQPLPLHPRHHTAAASTNSQHQPETTKPRRQPGTTSSRHQPATITLRHQAITTSLRHQPVIITPRQQLAAPRHQQPVTVTPTLKPAASRHQLTATSPRHHPMTTSLRQQPAQTQNQPPPADTTPRLAHIYSEDMVPATGTNATPSKHHTATTYLPATRESSKISKTSPRRVHWIHCSNKKRDMNAHFESLLKSTSISRHNIKSTSVCRQRMQPTATDSVKVNLETMLDEDSQPTPTPLMRSKSTTTLNLPVVNFYEVEDELAEMVWNCSSPGVSTDRCIQPLATSHQKWYFIPIDSSNSYR